MEVITSKSNEKVKFIKSLNEKKFRQKNMCFYLEGIKVVDEVLKSDRAVDIMFIALSSEILTYVNGGIDFLKRVENLKNDKKVTNIKVYDLKKEIFESVVDTKTPQGVLVVLKIKEYNLTEVLKTNNDKNNNKKNNYNNINNANNILLIDKVQDAGNMGTIIRTADAFGLNTILCMEGTVDVYSPKVIRSTMGSILRQKIVYLKNEELEILKNSDYRIVGTSLNTNTYIDELDFSIKSIFVLGNEANGMSEDVCSICNELVKIKMCGNAESLNVGVAAGIILYLQSK